MLNNVKKTIIFYWNFGITKIFFTFAVGNNQNFE